jgi:hypothetical protein
VGILGVLPLAVFVAAACGAESINPDENSPSAGAVVTGTVTDQLDRPVVGATVTSRVYQDGEFKGQFGMTSGPSTTDSAGRFTRQEVLPFTAAFQGCVLVMADPGAGSVLVPDSVTGLVEFRTEAPMDTLRVRIRLGTSGLGRD